MSIYDFTVKRQDGSEVSLSEYKGKVLLVLNTATDCGFTPQYDALQEIYNEFAGEGFDILDFPSNQFEQAQGSDQEIFAFCRGRFGITFPQLSKVELEGENASPLFTWLVENTEFGGFDREDEIGAWLDDEFRKADPDYDKSSSIKWNFTKFLIGRDGEIIRRFEPTVPMNVVKEEVKKAL